MSVEVRIDKVGNSNSYDVSYFAETNDGFVGGLSLDGVYNVLRGLTSVNGNPIRVYTDHRLHFLETVGKRLKEVGIEFTLADTMGDLRNLKTLLDFT